jgi:hypothetical protein
LVAGSADDGTVVSFFARPSRRLLFWAGLAGAAALLAGVGVLFGRGVQLEADAARRAEHTHQVIEQLLGVDAALG